MIKMKTYNLTIITKRNRKAKMMRPKARRVINNSRNTSLRVGIQSHSFKKIPMTAWRWAKIIKFKLSRNKNKMLIADRGLFTLVVKKT